MMEEERVRSDEKSTPPSAVQQTVDQTAEVSRGDDDVAPQTDSPDSFKIISCIAQSSGESTPESWQ